MKKIKYTFIMLFLASLTVQGKVILPPVLTFIPAPKEDIPDSIRVFFRKGSLINNTAGERISIKPDQNGVFRFSPSFIQPVYWFQMVFYYSNVNNRMQISGNENFYAEPNDDVKVIYQKHSNVACDFVGVLPKMKLSFSGNGAMKHKVSDLLRQITIELGRDLNENLKKEFGSDTSLKNRKLDSAFYCNSPEFNSYLNSVLNDVKTANRRVLDTLLKYHHQLSNDISTFFKYELASSKYFPFWIDLLFRSSKSECFRTKLYEFYLKNKPNVIDEINDLNVKYSNEYKHNKLMEIIYETTLKTSGDDINLSTLYNEIKHVNNIEMREVLVTFFLCQPWFQRRATNNESRDSCINDALNFIKSHELLAQLRKQLLFKRGSKVPSFSFLDANGNETTLESLKGKVFLLDFYFLGCVGCIQYAKRFKEEIYPEFADNQNFKVLSVSVDHKKEHWVSAMNSGIYNEKSYINLSAGSYEWKHPFLQSYGVTSFPFILLIDKNGRLVSRINNNQGTSEIIGLIKKALIIEPSR